MEVLTYCCTNDSSISLPSKCVVNGPLGWCPNYNPYTGGESLCHLLVWWRDDWSHHGLVLWEVAHWMYWMLITGCTLWFVLVVLVVLAVVCVLADALCSSYSSCSCHTGDCLLGYCLLGSVKVGTHVGEKSLISSSLQYSCFGYSFCGSCLQCYLFVLWLLITLLMV